MAFKVLWRNFRRSVLYLLCATENEKERSKDFFFVGSQITKDESDCEVPLERRERLIILYIKKLLFTLYYHLKVQKRERQRMLHHRLASFRIVPIRSFATTNITSVYLTKVFFSTSSTTITTTTTRLLLLISCHNHHILIIDYLIIQLLP